MQKESSVYTQNGRSKLRSLPKGIEQERKEEEQKGLLSGYFVLIFSVTWSLVSPHLKLLPSMKISQVPNIINSAHWQKGILKLISCYHCPFSRKKAENTVVCCLCSLQLAQHLNPPETGGVCGLCTSALKFSGFLLMFWPFPNPQCL